MRQLDSNVIGLVEEAGEGAWPFAVSEVKTILEEAVPTMKRLGSESRFRERLRKSGKRHSMIAPTLSGKTATVSGYVVDASVAIKWFIPEIHSPDAAPRDSPS
ncbi:MAG: hypothetical protein MRJ92_06655 [Nitrospira sp.]|nr:hypothetical protein [Nitrospira sp.]